MRRLYEKCLGRNRSLINGDYYYIVLHLISYLKHHNNLQVKFHFLLHTCKDRGSKAKKLIHSNIATKSNPGVLLQGQHCFHSPAHWRLYDNLRLFFQSRKVYHSLLEQDAHLQLAPCCPRSCFRWAPGF